jgi:hypothetical protein
MQLLRVFSIIITVLIIIASSSNISFKSGNDVNNGINTRVSHIVDNILLSSIDDKLIFSSLLQTISAEEQVQQEVDQEDKGKDSDSVIEREEEQDRGQSERESSIGQEQEQQDIEEEEQKQGDVKQDCRPGQHFDFEVGSCLPDQEKVCDEEKDTDSRVDPDCLTNKNDQEQQDNKHEDKEKLLPGEGEASLDNKEYDNGGKNPVPIEEQNNSLSSGSHNTKDKAQNSTQNLTDSHSTAATNNNNASLDESHQYANASVVEEVSFTLICDEEGAEMVPGTEDSITCTIENKTPKPIELVLGCSGLDSTGIECHINGQHSIGRTLINEMSYTNFSVLLVSRSSPPAPVGSYPFTISAEECINSDLC